MWRFCEFFKKTENAILSKFLQIPPFFKAIPPFFFRFWGTKKGEIGQNRFSVWTGPFCKRPGKGAFFEKARFFNCPKSPKSFFFFLNNDKKL